MLFITSFNYVPSTGFASFSSLVSLIRSTRDLRFLHPKMRRKVARKKTTMSKEQYVELVERVMVLMNSGFAVMCARDGSMESV